MRKKPEQERIFCSVFYFLKRMKKKKKVLKEEKMDGWVLLKKIWKEHMEKIMHE